MTVHNRDWPWNCAQTQFCKCTHIFQALLQAFLTLSHTHTHPSCLIGFQLEHFGQRCFGTRVDQIWFSFKAEKLPVTASNGWEPMDRNKAFVSLPSKTKQRKRSQIKVHLHLHKNSSRSKNSCHFLVPIFTCQKCCCAFSSLAHRKKINLHYKCFWDDFSTKLHSNQSTGELFHYGRVVVDKMTTCTECCWENRILR